MIKMKSGVKLTSITPQYTYASIDIETLGLDPNKHKIIEVAVVLDNHLHRIDYSSINHYIKKLPFYHCYIRHDSYDGSPYALNLNRDIIDKINSNKVKNIIIEDYLAVQLHDFFKEHCNKKIMPAGKNFGGFDRQFLNNVVTNKPIEVKDVLDEWLIHRTLDPAMYFFDENVDDKLPSLQECLEKANFNTKVKHTAVEDAYDVIRCLRYKWDYSPLKNM